MVIFNKAFKPRQPTAQDKDPNEDLGSFVKRRFAKRAAKRQLKAGNIAAKHNFKIAKQNARQTGVAMGPAKAEARANLKAVKNSNRANFKAQKKSGFKSQVNAFGQSTAGRVPATKKSAGESHSIARGATGL